MMAANQLLLEDDGIGGGDVFVYSGGEQEAPRDVRRVRIAENVDTILARTFINCQQLIDVEGHNKLKKIERGAFSDVEIQQDTGPSLTRVMKMTGLIEIDRYAFCNCHTLSELMEVDKLEIIGYRAFMCCTSLRSVYLPSIRSVGAWAFQNCKALTDVVLGEKLDRIDGSVFWGCTALRRITIPLKDNFRFVANYAFACCDNLSRVDVVGGIHETINSLHLERWRNEMQEEIDRINQTLPATLAKSQAIQQWITSVFGRMENYKREHQIMVKEAMALLELALWKAKLLNETDEKKCNIDEVTKKAKIDAKAARKEHRVTCGASIAIKNVLPFLALK
jgi:hypothetical protein